MKVDFAKIVKVLSKVPVLGVVLAAFMLGYLFKGAVVTAPPASPPEAGVDSKTQTEIWTCSMHPQIRLLKPGKCPLCGMELVLADDAPKAEQPQQAKKKRYACAMMCVPPMARPGKCPICGMDMVEVAEHADGSAEDAGPRTLTLSPTAQKLAEIQVASVVRKFVSAEIRMVGKIDYDETRLGYITAWVPGRLDRLYVDYTGVPVKKGDHMVYLYSPDLRSTQVDLLEAIRTAAKLEKSSYESIRASAPGMVEDIRKRLSLWGLTDEQIAEIEKRGTPTDHMTIYSPMGGIVIHKNGLEGMYVQTGTRIYTIADLSRVWVKLDAYESDLMWLRYGQEVEFETEAYPGETFIGKIAFIDPVLNATTRTVKVRVNVDNANGRLKPEMFVRAVARAKVAEGGQIVSSELAGKWICPMHPEVVKDEPASCDVCGMPLVRAESLGFVSAEPGNGVPPLVIPASAPLITGKRALVYVQLPGKPGSYQGRQITLGPRAGDHYLVHKGLAEDELVVVNGNFKIDSAVQILAKPSMMSPETGQPPPVHQHRPDPGAAQRADHKPTSRPRQAMDGRESEALDVPDTFRAQLRPLLDAYFQIQKPLSHDKLTEAQSAAKVLSKAIDDVDMSLLVGRAHNLWMKESGGIKKTAADIAAAGNIQKARAGFALLSESMIAVAKRFGTGKQTVYRFHCSMAFDDRGADWLQNKNKTENPYFGSAMFRCGIIKETIGTIRPDRDDGRPAE